MWYNIDLNACQYVKKKVRSINKSEKRQIYVWETRLRQDEIAAMLTIAKSYRLGNVKIKAMEPIITCKIIKI